MLDHKYVAYLGFWGRIHEKGAVKAKGQVPPDHRENAAPGDLQPQ